jgi:hypothetical protein
MPREFTPHLISPSARAACARGGRVAPISSRVPITPHFEGGYRYTIERFAPREGGVIRHRVVLPVIHGMRSWCAASTRPQIARRVRASRFILLGGHNVTCRHGWRDATRRMARCENRLIGAFGGSLFEPSLNGRRWPLGHRLGTNVSWGMPTARKVPGGGHRMGVGRRGEVCMHPKK